MVAFRLKVVDDKSSTSRGRLRSTSRRRQRLSSAGKESRNPAHAAAGPWESGLERLERTRTHEGLPQRKIKLRSRLAAARSGTCQGCTRRYGLGALMGYLSRRRSLSRSAKSGNDAGNRVFRPPPIAVPARRCAYRVENSIRHAR